MKSGLNVIAVDIGSSSVKAAVVSVAGDVIASSRARVDRSLPFPEMWLAAMREALAAVLSAYGLSEAGARSAFGRVDSLIVSGAGPSLVAVDEKGKALASLLWDDPAPPCDSPAPEGAESSIFFPRIAALPKMFPGVERKARRVLSGPEFAVFCLCGGECSVLPEKRYVPAYWTGELVEAAGFGARQFPPFCEPGSCAGAFKEDATPYSRALAGTLPEGLKVRAGPPDFAAAILGTGTVAPGRACDRAGTSEGLNVCTAAAVYAEGLRTLPSPAAGLWNVSCLFEGTGKELARIRACSPRYACMPYEEIFREISESPIIPAAGEEPSPAREAAERICLKVKGGIERLKAATGMAHEFVVAGGQAKSRAWCQMKADITGATFLLTQTESAELLGDAAAAFRAAGEYASCEEACAAMVRIGARFEPDAARSALYREKRGE